MKKLVMLGLVLGLGLFLSGCSTHQEVEPVIGAVSSGTDLIGYFRN